MANMGNTSQYNRTYTSFSGCDILAIFTGIPNSVSKEGTAPAVIGEMQGISYSITREKAPIYTLGSPDPRSFSRGKRGIAGSLIFTQFDRHPMHRIINNSKYLAHVEEDAIVPVDEIAEYTTLRVATARYADQVPGFDITISAMNEYGQIAQMRVMAVEILNEGSGLSVDDIVNEAQMTYVAREIYPWTPVINKTESGIAASDILDQDQANAVEGLLFSGGIASTTGTPFTIGT